MQADLIIVLIWNLCEKSIVLLESKSHALSFASLKEKIYNGVLHMNFRAVWERDLPAFDPAQPFWIYGYNVLCLKYNTLATLIHRY